MSAEEFTGLGFAPGSVKGVRSFKVDKFGRLTGVTFEKVWTPGENSAECLRDDSMNSMWQMLTGITNSYSVRSNYYLGAGGGVYVDPTTPPTPTLPPSVSMGSQFGRRGKGKGGVVTVPKSIPGTPAVNRGTSEDIEAAKPAHSLETCKCGFYGYFDGSDDYHDNGRITAVVEAYGEVIIGTRGFRAMKARILAVRVKPDDDGIAGHMARKISNNYKGVAIFDNFDQMIAEFPPDVSLEPSPDSDPDFWTRGI
jgi:hypothetical protein